MMYWTELKHKIDVLTPFIFMAFLLVCFFYYIGLAALEDLKRKWGKRK